MLEEFTLTRIGFHESLKINDVFEFKNDYWIIRSITNSKLKNRPVKGFNGRYGWQSDVIVADVIAQKVGTFDIQNLTSKVTEMTFSMNTVKITHEDDIVNVGEVTTCSDGRTYILTEIKDISYSFTDIRMVLVGMSITELIVPETKKLAHNHKLNELGWEVLKSRSVLRHNNSVGGGD